NLVVQDCQDCQVARSIEGGNCRQARTAERLRFVHLPIRRYLNLRIRQLVQVDQHAGRAGWLLSLLGRAHTVDVIDLGNLAYAAVARDHTRATVRALHGALGPPCRLHSAVVAHGLAATGAGDLVTPDGLDELSRPTTRHARDGVDVRQA